MKIICKVNACRYCSTSNFCTKSFVFINAMGGCGRIYNNNGQVKANWNEQEDEYERRAPDMSDITSGQNIINQDPAKGEGNDTK